MGAKIFISWSGEISKALAEAVRDWIPKVLQTVKPYFTPDDIEKGSRWAKEISNELAASQFGIICLTQDNQHSPWILFEAGALSKNLEESKVCPILFNFDATELKGPLASFQATKFNKDDIKKLLESINNSCSETKLEQKSLDETFEMWWPKLEKSIETILSKSSSVSKPKKRSDRDILEEILELARSNAKAFISEQTQVSNITIEDLVARHRSIKEKYSMGQNIDSELVKMENTIIRLCKEVNLEDICFRRYSSHLLGMRKLNDFPLKKNSFPSDSLKRKISSFEGDDMKGIINKNDL